MFNMMNTKLVKFCPGRLISRTTKCPYPAPSPDLSAFCADLLTDERRTSYATSLERLREK